MEGESELPAPSADEGLWEMFGMLPTSAKPLGLLAAGTGAGVIGEADGDRLRLCCGAVLHDDPGPAAHQWKGEAVAGFHDGELGGGNDAASAVRGECLRGHGQSLLLAVEQGEVELVAFDANLALEGGFFVNDEEASSVRAEIHAFMGECLEGDQTEYEGE